MSPERPSLRERFAADLRSGSLPALLTAVPLATAIGLGSARYVDEHAVGFYALLLVGVFVPYAHETYRPQDRSCPADAAWTAVAAAVASGLFFGGYALAGAVVDDPTHAATAAFAGTIVCGGLAARLLRG